MRNCCYERESAILSGDIRERITKFTENWAVLLREFIEKLAYVKIQKSIASHAAVFMQSSFSSS